MKLKSSQDVSFFERLVASYLNPLMRYSMTNKVELEQLGELPEHLSTKKQAERLDASIRFCHEQDPKDKYALARGIFRVYRWEVLWFCAFKLLFSLKEVIIPMLMVNFIAWLQETLPEGAS